MQCIISHFLIQNNSILLDQVFSFLTWIVKKHWTSSTILNTILLLGNSLLAKNLVLKMKSSEFWDKTDNYNVDLICRIFEQQYTLKFWGSCSTQDTIDSVISLISIALFTARATDNGSDKQYQLKQVFNFFVKLTYIQHKFFIFIKLKVELVISLRC